MQSEIAKTQTELGARELELVLALVRGGTLAAAGRRLGVDTSTVHRALHRLEKSLRQPLFERRHGRLVPGPLAEELAQRGEAIEGQVELARERLLGDDHPLAGALRVTTTDTLLAGHVLPVLAAFARGYPHIDIELVASNAIASLSRREADIAIRPTREPPGHLVGARLGRIDSALFASRRYLDANPSLASPAQMDWAAPDDSLAEHPSIGWRQRHFPGVVPRFRSNSLLTLAQMIEQGLAIGVVPRFLLAGRPDIVELGEPIAELDVDLWALTHPDVRHLRRVKVFFDFLKDHLRFDAVAGT